jgi:polar amino acid transport system substrate-binding protein
MALTKKNHAVFGTIRTKEREDKFEWIGPISSSRWVLFARSDSKIKISKLEDAKKYVIGGYINDAKSTFLIDHGLRVETVNQNHINVKKLQKGRIDLWVAGSTSGRAIAAKEKQVFKEVFAFRRIEGFLAANKQSDKKTIKKLQREIAAMNQEGEISRIVESYFKDNQ